MCPRQMIVDGVTRQDSAQVPLAEDDQVVQTFPPDRPDQALRVRIGVSCRLHRQRAVRHKPFVLPIPSIRCTAGRFS
jgi:hypothetical protein